MILEKIYELFISHKKNMKNTQKEIKLKCLDIQIRNIDSKLQTLESLNYKIGIFFWLFFLVFFENLNFLLDANIFFKITLIFLSSISIFLLYKAISVLAVDKLYPNINNTMKYEWEFEIDWFIDQRHKDYNQIEISIDQLIQKRNNFFIYWVILFLFSLLPAIIYFLNK